MPRNSLKPKKKLKTHRGAKKRFKITANGKILRMHSGKRHLLGSKAPGRMRSILPLAVILKRFFAPRCVFSFFFGFSELRGISFEPSPSRPVMPSSGNPRRN